MSTLKERFDEAFYGLLHAGDNLIEINKKLDYAKTLIQKNKTKQELIEGILNEDINI